MAENVDLSLMQKLIDRAVQDRLQPLQNQLWAQHWLLRAANTTYPRSVSR